MKSLPINLKKSNYGIEFVLKAVAGKKENREVLKCVFVDKCKLVATDGARLHIFEDDSVRETFEADGIYDVVCNKDRTFIDKKIDLIFPEYLKVIPEDKGIFLTLDIKDYEISISQAIILLSRQAQKQNYGIKIEYVSDLAGYKWDLKVDMETSKVFKLVSGKMTAVISPFEIKQ